MASHRSRAVTPGSLFLLAAFVLLLLSVISAPVTRFSKLGEDSAFTYGVLGYCPIGSGSCSSAGVGYDFPSGADTDYLLSSIRGTLAKILVVHIPAAALTLINLIFAGFAHLRSGAHSPRYLCFVAVLPLVSSIITLLAFVIDILVFWPHCAWGTWITLAAFILNMFASLLICCASRTVRNRKARKRSIDQDADMNAADYYSQQRALDSELATADANSLPKFASFEAPSNRTLNEPVGGSTTKLP
ncbi:pali-domain-containing protein, partial [Saitoella complicata NRRL Y-17804]